MASYLKRFLNRVVLINLKEIKLVTMETSKQNLYGKTTIRSGDLNYLFAVLKDKGYTIIGPAIRQGAIGYEELSSVSDLPKGWTDVQEGGTYRIKKRTDNSYFGFNVGPHSWKKFLFPPSLRLWQATRKGKGFEITDRPQNANPKYAFLGVRACELHALEIQDKVFMEGKHVDPTYQLRREKALIIAVNCSRAGGTCFCTSMNTGPEATSGFDLALTEIIWDKEHYFLVEIGTETGAEIMEKVPNAKADKNDIDIAKKIVEKTAANMGRIMDTAGLKELLYESHESDVWDDVSKRCLSCGNCTLACPTCFCSSVEDVTDLAGDTSERWRKWDSCFNIEFSYIHGGSVRTSVQSRYRQWITHKLASWIDQFGTFGLCRLRKMHHLVSGRN